MPNRRKQSVVCRCLAWMSEAHEAQGALAGTLIGAVFLVYNGLPVGALKTALGYVISSCISMLLLAGTLWWLYDKLLKEKPSDYDDGSDFTPTSAHQQRAQARRQRLEQQRKQEAERQRREWEEQEDRKYQAWLRREQRKREELAKLESKLFKSFVRFLESELAKEQRQYQKQQDKQQQHQQQQQQKSAKSYFDGQMGYGSQEVPDGCEGTVQQVLLARDYYAVLGLQQGENPTPERLRAARKAKALLVHPDKIGHDTPGANLASSRVNYAYETLSDSRRRRDYDRYIASKGKRSVA